MEKILLNNEWIVTYLSDGSRTEIIDLPHDASISMERDPNAPNGHAKGYYPNVRLVYQKFIEIPENYQGKTVLFHFDGAYTNAKVWINGDYAGGCYTGYDAFTIPADNYLKFGAKNEIKVELKSGEDSRWYSGSGLYRNVWMLVGDFLHIPEYGVKLTTKEADEEIACIEAAIIVENQHLRNKEIIIRTTFRNTQSDELCAKDERIMHIGGSSTDVIRPRIYISSPQLWDPDTPNLYDVCIQLFENGNEIDSYSLRYGIRTFSLDNKRGLRINGKGIKIYGCCIHHDNGVVGAATYSELEERRIRLLKDAGYNAIRSSHHPISEELLDACDRLGMLIWDELNDTWNEYKSPDDSALYFHSSWRNMIKGMVNKDYNHASVVFYSIGNEIGEIAHPGGMRRSRELVEAIRNLDQTRYITNGVNSIIILFTAAPQEKKQEAKTEKDINFIMNQLMSQMSAIQCQDFIIDGIREAMESLDIVGYNYAEDRYLIDIARFDNRICIGSETYPKSLAKNWDLVNQNPAVIGDFSWTGWDYLGEAGIGKNDVYENANEGIYRQYPYYLANVGDFDIIGNRRSQSYYREIVVGHRRDPYIAVLNPKEYEAEIQKTPWSWSDSYNTWNFNGYEEKPIQVEVYGKGTHAELIINGISCGKKQITQRSSENECAFCTVFDTIYVPGEVKALLYNADRVIGQQIIKTTDSAAKILVVEDYQNKTDSTVLIYEVCITDKHNNVVTDNDQKIFIQISGGTLIGFGSADPYSKEIFTNGAFTSYHGKALLVIKRTKKEKIHIIAHTSQLRGEFHE